MTEVNMCYMTQGMLYTVTRVCVCVCVCVTPEHDTYVHSDKHFKQ
jgi:hypothetical protein